jgi:hypothetical protein
MGKALLGRGVRLGFGGRLGDGEWCV